jgi:hypothetical protein
MSYKPKRMTYFERSFVIGSSFLSAGAFVLCGHRLLSAAFPPYAYFFYFATLSMCLQIILRYFIVARVYHTERDLWAWSLSMTIALLGPITVYESLLGSTWFLCVVLLMILGSRKTIQSQKAIAINSTLTDEQKDILLRIQVGTCWYQWYVAFVMLGFWVATSLRLGDTIALRWFGVSDLPAWRNGVATLGGIVCLLASAHLAVRILVWHREYLRPFPTAPKNDGSTLSRAPLPSVVMSIQVLKERQDQSVRDLMQRKHSIQGKDSSCEDRESPSQSRWKRREG